MSSGSNIVAGNPYAGYSNAVGRSQNASMAGGHKKKTSSQSQSALQKLSSQNSLKGSVYVPMKESVFQMDVSSQAQMHLHQVKVNQQKLKNFDVHKYQKVPQKAALNTSLLKSSKKEKLIEDQLDSREPTKSRAINEYEHKP